MCVLLLLMLFEQSYPGRYARDMEAMGDGVAAAMEKKVAGFGDLPPPTVAEEEASRRAWEEAYDEPYERAGTVFDPAAAPARAALGWYAAEADANSRYKAMQPRFLMEVSCSLSLFFRLKTFLTYIFLKSFRFLIYPV